MEARYHLICPSCRKSETRVVDSRDDENVVRRRRECLDCKSRFTTYERMEAPRLFVVKKDGRREQYNREKVLSGLLRACEKRPVSMETIEEIADRIEAAAAELGGVGACSDAAWLRARVKPPADPVTAARVLSLRNALAKIKAMLSAGK